MNEILLKKILLLFHLYILDLFLTIDNNNKPRFRVYQLPLTQMTLITEYDPPDGVKLYHLSTFADIGK